MSSSTWFAALAHPAPADLEQWLEAKAADGHILTSYSRLSPIRMTFTDSAPAQVRYAVERRSAPAPADYYRFREQEGWEHVGHAAEFHLWRREYTGERPSGFIGESLNHRASQFGVRLAVVAAIAAAVTVVLAVLAGAEAFASDSVNLWAPAIVTGVIFVVAAVGAIALAVSSRKAALKTTAPDVKAKISA